MLCLCRWYHEGFTRHIAEALLMGKAIRDGVYLLRDSNQGAESLTLSVRYIIINIIIILCM